MSKINKSMSYIIIEKTSHWVYNFIRKEGIL